MMGLLSEGADGHLLSGQNHGNFYTNLESHNTFYILIQNLKVLKLYPGLQSDCGLEMHEQRGDFQPKDMIIVDFEEPEREHWQVSDFH